MPTTNRIFPLILLPTITEEAFDQFLNEEFATYVWPDGRSHSVLKATKGHCLPQYLMIWQIESEFNELSLEEQKKLNESCTKNLDNKKIVDKLLAFVENIFPDGASVEYEQAW